MGSFNRQACFNELSTFDKCEDAFQLFFDYAKTIKTLKEKGFSGIRYEYGISSLIKEKEWNVYDIIKQNPRARDLLLLILTTARKPYIDPDTKEEDRYINENLEVLIDDKWCVGQGFIAAYLLDTIVISLCTHSKWNNISYVIRNQLNETEQGFVLNVANSESVETDAINNFILQRTPVVLVKCNILPNEKNYKFRDDHGKDKLNSLWLRLKNCEYIVSAINSLKFNSKGTEFIERCCEDGKIYIRLVDSDAGYGMVIETTGRNLQETVAIGEIIEQDYR